MKRFLLLLCAFIVSSAWATTPSSRIKFVEYIESSGTQYINTGFFPTNKNVRLEMKYRFVSLPSDSSSPRKYVFGWAANDNSSTLMRFQYAIGSAGNCALGFGKGWNSKATVDSYDTTTDHTIVCDGGVFTLNGVVVTNMSSATFNTPKQSCTMYLFANNNKGSVGSEYIPSMRLYSCKIWDNGVLVRDFEPALDSASTPCLYNSAGGDFYYNAGSGSFTAGAVTREIQVSYRNADYIEANRTAYIDTKYVPNGSTELEMDFAFTTILTSKTYVFGSYGDDAGRLQFSYGPADTGCFVGYGNKFDRAVPGLPYNTERHIVKYVQAPQKGFYFDDIFVNANTQTNLTTWSGTGANLFLGQINSNGARPSLANCAPIRIYSCKIWENGVMVRDMVPKQRLFDKEKKNGLYDNVTGNFYVYNGPEADFTALLAPKNTVILLR